MVPSQSPVVFPMAWLRAKSQANQEDVLDEILVSGEFDQVVSQPFLLRFPLTRSRLKALLSPLLDPSTVL